MLGLICGFIAFFVLKQFWAFPIGYFVGWYIQNKLILSGKSNTNVDPDLFLTILFETLGALCKSKGRVTENDIQFVSQSLNQFNLNSDQKKELKVAFNQGKSTNYPLRLRLNELYQQYRRSPNLLNTFCEQLIKVAVLDGSIHKNEEQIILIVIEELHLSRMRILRFIQMALITQQFQRQQKSGQHYSYRQYEHQQHYSQTNYADDSVQLKNAYSTLGVNEDDTPSTIKRAYRKLMNEYHPDKLVSKGLPKEMLESAKQRAQEIQSAYEKIKAHRGFK